MELLSNADIKKVLLNILIDLQEACKKTTYISICLEDPFSVQSDIKD